jgi:hypothetical protein
MAILGTTALTGCSSIPDFIATGTLTFFRQTNSPTSWVKQTTHDNKALRVVSGTVGSGGTRTFTQVFTTVIPSASTSSNTISTTQMGIHGHLVSNGTLHWRTSTVGPIGNPGVGTAIRRAGDVQTAAPTGSGSSHNHSLSIGSVNFNISYVDVILASKQ